MALLQGLFGAPNVEKLAAKRDVSGLIRALGYEKDADVRRAAAEALGRSGDARGVEPLIAALNNPDSGVQLEAAMALGQIGDARAVTPLVAALKDTGGDVRPVIVRALDRLGWQPPADTTGAIYYVTKQDWQRCYEIGVAAVDPLLSALRDRNGEMRRSAAQVLVALYRDGDLREEDKQRLLSLRTTIMEPHKDYVTDSDNPAVHMDNHEDLNTPHADHNDAAGGYPYSVHSDTGGHTDTGHSDSRPHSDSRWHTDVGIGLEI